MSDVQSMTPLESIDAPWNKKIEIQDIVYEGGLPALRIRIREGKRFTLLDLDRDTADRLAREISSWVAAQDGG